MSKSKNTGKALVDSHRTPSAVATAARLRGGAGVHADQRRKADPKAIRKNKDYKDRSNW